MIECNELFNVSDDIDYTNIEEDYNHSTEITNDKSIESEKVSKKSMHVSKKSNNILNKAEVLSQYKNIKPIKLIKSSLDQGQTVKEFRSKASERRSRSAVSSGSKTSELNELLEKVVEENDIMTIEPKKIIKEKKNMENYIPPKPVATKNSKCSISSRAESYYQKQRSNKESNDSSMDQYHVLRKMIEVFIELDKNCMRLAEESKAYKEEKKQYEEYILSMMEKHKTEQITHNNTSLRRDVKMSKPKPTEADMLQTLIKVFNDESMASQVTKAIIDSVSEEEKISLKKGAKKAVKPKK